MRLAFRSHSIRPVSGHTFLCGQSGSGKTYSLGVVLERLLLETDLRLISDFARLGELRLDTNDADTARYLEATRSLAVRRAGDGLALLLAGLEREGEAGRRLIGPARNLGLHRWGVWAGTERRSILPELTRDDVRCLVVDLGSLATREEQAGDARSAGRS